MQIFKIYILNFSKKKKSEIIPYFLLIFFFTMHFLHNLINIQFYLFHNNLYRYRNIQVFLTLD